MGSLHTFKVLPGTKAETRLEQLLHEAGVKPELVICKRGKDFETKYDEYYFSDGLYNIIGLALEKIRKEK